MTATKLAPSIAAAVWALAAQQHGVIARRQLLALGMHRRAIQRRITSSRLHIVAPGIYAVGRRDLTREGHWMVAVLACGPGAVLSHSSAAALWVFGIEKLGVREVSIPRDARRRRSGLVIHRFARDPSELTSHRDIPVTTPISTMIDIANRMAASRLERAINEADKRDLFTPDELRAALDRYPGRTGVAAIRRILDPLAFTLTDSELERLFRGISRRVGLPLPETGAEVNGYDVDFYWPELGIVVETDGLRYHRTPAQQTRDRLRDQAHTAAGLVPLRFTRWQVKYDPRHVEKTLAAVAARRRQAT